MRTRLWALCLMAASTLVHANDGIRESIIERCRAQMGEFGASMVKFCVDEDLAAYQALQGYRERHRVIIDRCARQMLDLTGWATVKFCADEDIKAERALEAYD